jgi:hypothetical protein
MKKILIGILVLVILAVVGYLAYMNQSIRAALSMNTPAVAPTTTATSTSARAPLPGFARGSIEELNDNGFILTLMSGATRTVMISATTTVYNYAAASSTPTIINSNALSVGESVLVLGDAATVNSDLTANVIVTGVLPGKGHVKSTLVQSGIQLPDSIASATPPLDR